MLKHYTILVFLLLLVGKNGNAQNHQFSFETGYNRIGIFFNPHFGIDIKNHQIHFGIKTYGFNLFFQDNPIGPQIGYQYQFNTVNDKLFFYPAVSYSFFREQKLNSNLLLSEVNLKYALGINLTDKIALVNEVGVGYIMTNANLFNELNTIKSAFPSFEISLGLVFHLNKSASK